MFIFDLFYKMYFYYFICVIVKIYRILAVQIQISD